MKREKKLRSITSKYKIINIVLYPEEEQQAANYVKVLSQIHSTHHSTKVGTDRYFQLFKFDKGEDFYKGEICSYIKVDQKAFDEEKNAIVDTDADPTKGYNPKLWNYWFFPKYHRMIIPSACSLNQITKFLSDSFKEYFNGDDSRFAINVEKDFSSIEYIINAPKVTSLEISLSYSNNGNNDGWTKIIDNQMRESNVTKSNLSFKGSVDNPLKIKEASMISGALYLSKSNGTAKAHIRNKDGHSEVINTDNHPQIVSISHNEEDIDEKMRDLANDIHLNKHE